MIAITKESDSAKITKILEEEGIVFSEDITVITAKDSEEVFGYSLFSLKDKLHVINISTNSLLWNSIGDGLFRATLNFAIEKGVLSATIDEDLLKKLLGSIIPIDKATAEIENCERFLQETKRCIR